MKNKKSGSGSSVNCSTCTHKRKAPNNYLVLIKQLLCTHKRKAPNNYLECII